MAEALAAIGVVASVAQLADYGFKLSVKLFAYSQAVYKADKTIRSFSNEVSLTASVLKELAGILESKESMVSSRALEATQATVKECLDVFDSLNAILEKSMGAAVSGERAPTDSAAAKVGTLERLKWPFVQPKVDLLRSNLDRLKASLTLMLQVLSFARDLATQSQAASSDTLQRHMIERLARSELEATKRYNQLLLALQKPSDTLTSHNPLGDAGPESPSINTHSLPVKPLNQSETQLCLLQSQLSLCLEFVSGTLSQLDATASDGNEPRHASLQRTIDASQEAVYTHWTHILGPMRAREHHVKVLDGARGLLPLLLDMTKSLDIEKQDALPAPPPPTTAAASPPTVSMRTRPAPGVGRPRVGGRRDKSRLRPAQTAASPMLVPVERESERPLVAGLRTARDSYSALELEVTGDVEAALGHAHLASDEETEDDDDDEDDSEDEQDGRDKHQNELNESDELYGKRKEKDHVDVIARLLAEWTTIP